MSIDSDTEALPRKNRWAAKRSVEGDISPGLRKHITQAAKKIRIFGDEFTKDVKAMGIKEVLSAPRSPWQSAYVERVIGTIRRECPSSESEVHHGRRRHSWTRDDDGISFTRKRADIGP